jgi:hypothetical protein
MNLVPLLASAPPTPRAGFSLGIAPWMLVTFAVASAVFAIFLRLLVARLSAGRKGSIGIAAGSVSDAPSRYRTKASISTPGGLAFFPALRAAVGGQAVVMCSVRLADVLEPAPGRPGWQRLFNRICSKHADFVLCEPGTLRPLAIVELDDPSHRRADRQKRDRLVDAVAASAGLPILHVPTAGAYAPDAIRARLTPGILPSSPSHKPATGHRFGM